MVSDVAVTLCMAVSVSHGMYDQQEVSNISVFLFWPGSLIAWQTACKRDCQDFLSATLHWPTVCEWYCRNLLPGSFITLTTSLWVIPEQFSSSLITLTYSKWVWMWLSTRHSYDIDPMTNRMWVSLLQHTTITSHPVTNRKWVTLQWFSAITTMISFHDQQGVSDTVVIFCWELSDLIQWPSACECFQMHGILMALLNCIITNSLWVTLVTFCQVISSHFVLANRVWVKLYWFTSAVSLYFSKWVVLEWVSTRQSQHPHFMTNRLWVTIQWFQPGSFSSHWPSGCGWHCSDFLMPISFHSMTNS